MEQFENKDIEQLAAAIGHSSRIVISTHRNPDGDAIGSSLGLLAYLLDKGREATVLFPTPPPSNLSFMFSKSLKKHIAVYENEAGETVGAEECLEALRNADTLISADYNDVTRAGGLCDALRAFRGYKILMDHHPGPDSGFYDLVFSATDVSSASEIVFWILRALEQGGRIGGRIGRALLTGMTTDSNNFANSVYPSTLEMTGLLLEAGVNRDRILDKLYRQYRPNRFRLLGHILGEKLYLSAHGAAITLLSSDEIRRFGVIEGETEGFVNVPLGIKDVKLSIFVRQEHDRYRVSLRSKEGTSANRCARLYFHGGGHELAAGGSLHTPEDAPDIDALFEYIKESAERFLTASAPEPGEDAED